MNSEPTAGAFLRRPHPGGGVYAGGIVKTVGIIYGNNGGASSNTAKSGDGNGHAVYVSSNSRYRDTTAGTGVDLIGSDTTNWNE